MDDREPDQVAVELCHDDVVARARSQQLEAASDGLGRRWIPELLEKRRQPQRIVGAGVADRHVHRSRTTVAGTRAPEGVARTPAGDDQQRLDRKAIAAVRRCVT